MAKKRDLTIKQRRHTPPVEEPASVAEEEKPSPKKRKKRRRRPRSMVWLILFRLLLVIALVMSGVLIWRNWDRLAPAAVSEWFDRVITGGEGGEGYPTAITGSSVVAMEDCSGNAAVLTDTQLLFYNTSGAQVAARGHTYADPMLATAGNYALVAELGGTRYTLNTKKSVVTSGSAGNALRSAAVNSSGQVAVATESSQSYMSEVVVFDRAGKELFHWYSSDLTVVDVALSPNAKRVAVLGLSAQGGEMKSTLLVFPLSGGNGKPEYTYSATGAMMAAVHYFQNGNIAVVGDTAAWVCDTGKKDAAVTAYDNALLLGYAFSDSGMALATRTFGESSGGHLTVVTPAGKQTATVAFSGDFRHLSSADGGFYLLTGGTLYRADTVGFAKQAAVAADGLQVVEMHGKPLVLSLTALDRCEWSKEATE